MANELFAAAGEIRLQLAANSIEGALRSACEGLKRFLNDPRQVYEFGNVVDSVGKVKLGSTNYVDALEKALDAAGVDPLTTQDLVANLSVALLELATEAMAPDETSRNQAFRSALQSQQVICTLPGEIAQHEPSRRDLKKALAKVTVALGAAGGIALLATPGGLGALGLSAAAATAAAPAAGGVAAIVAVLNVALEHVFGKAVDSAWDSLKQVKERPPTVVVCRCHDKKPD